MPSSDHRVQFSEFNIFYFRSISLKLLGLGYSYLDLRLLGFRAFELQAEGNRGFGLRIKSPGLHDFDKVVGIQILTPDPKIKTSKP